MPLRRLNWIARNYLLLSRFTDTVKRGDIAVFDWDNTCIFGDIGEAVLRHQALHLQFKFTPERLRTIIPDQVLGIDRIRLSDRFMPLPEIKKRIGAAYEKIFGRNVKDVRAGAAYRDFCAGLLALNHGFEETPGIGCEFAYPWTVNFLQGFSPDAVRRLAAEVIDNELQAAIRDRSRRGARKGFLYRWTAGIRPFPEMADLARHLQNAGCRIIVSTASNPLIVETMMQRTGFEAEKVIGMAAHMEDGILQGAPSTSQALNFGSGKTENLKRLLGAEPVFVAGDSDGDYDMLTAYPGTRLRLLIRRVQPGNVACLYQKALAGDRGYLLQDVDQAAGRFSSSAGPFSVAL